MYVDDGAVSSRQWLVPYGYYYSNLFFVPIFDLCRAMLYVGQYMQVYSKGPSALMLL